MSIINSFIDAYSSIWYGILVAVIVVAALFFIIAAIQGTKKRFSPLTYVLGAALTAFLSFQFMFMIGAIMFKIDCNDVTSMINDFVPNSSLTSSSNDLRSNLKQLAEEEPFIKNFIDVDMIDKNLPDGAIGDAILSKVHTYLNWYIVRRVLWSLLAIGIVGTLMYISMERIPQGRTRRTPGYRSSNRRRSNDDF
jgi:hypothetical protein